MIKITWISQNEMTTGQKGELVYKFGTNMCLLSENTPPEKLITSLDLVIDKTDIIAIDSNYSLEFKRKLLEQANLRQKTVIISLSEDTGSWKRIKEINLQIVLEDFYYPSR